MKIFFILKNTYPKGMASTARVRCYGQGFINEGYETHVLLPISLEPHGSKQINKLSKGTDENGVHYQYMSGSSLRGNNIIMRQINDLWGYFHTLLYIIFHIRKNDQVIVYEGGVIWHLCCITAIHLKGAKATMELNELPFGTGKETSKKIRNRKLMLRHIFPRYDQFLTISESLKELVLQNAPKAKVFKVPILISPKPQPETTSPTDKTYLFHSGTLSQQKDGILGIIEAFGKVCQQIETPVYYYFTGNLNVSPCRSAIENLISQYHIEDRIKFLGYLEDFEVQRYQRHCALSVIYKYPTQQNKYCFSTKLGEYLMTSRPVIITSVGEATHYLQDGQTAYIIPPDDTDLLAKTIVDVLTHPTEAQKIGNAGKELAEKVFNTNYQARRIIQFFKDGIAS